MSPSDFAYVRAGFFPGTAQRYATLLKRLGTPTRTQLVEREKLGDDRVSVFELTFAGAAYYARLALAPDSRVSAFSLSRKSEP